MMAKKAKRLTAKRQVFLDALHIINNYDRTDGIDFLKLADDLTVLLDKAPKSGWMAAEWAICSALWASDCPAEVPQDIDKVHEHCKGGELFMVAYMLGWIHAMSKRSAKE
jgi:hypothetical protein